MAIKPRSVSLPAEMWQWLDKKAKEDDCSASRIVRAAIRKYQETEIPIGADEVGPDGQNVKRVAKS